MYSYCLTHFLSFLVLFTKVTNGQRESWVTAQVNWVGTSLFIFVIREKTSSNGNPKKLKLTSSQFHDSLKKFLHVLYRHCLKHTFLEGTISQNFVKCFCSQTLSSSKVNYSFCRKVMVFLTPCVLSLSGFILHYFMKLYLPWRMFRLV